MDNRYIHPSAIIEEGAIIGASTHIWHFCHLMPASKVGENCNIGQNVFIDNNAIVGNRVKIQNNVSVYNGVVIEDDVFIGPSAVFTNVINPRSFIERKKEFRKTIVKTGATIGANATILCGVEIGKYSMVGAGAVITKNMGDHSIFTGNPAAQNGWISKAGFRLEFDSKNEAICSGTGEIYKLENNSVFPLK